MALQSAQLKACTSRLASPRVPTVSRTALIAPVLPGRAPARPFTKRTNAANTNVGDFRSQEARWESQIRDGKVRNISGKDAAQMMKDGWVMLDVRPPNEADRAPITGAVRVPLFVPDQSNDASSMIKKATAFGMGGWWLGGTHYIPNNNFMGEVQARVPKDAKVIVGCQKGLRSLAACEQLSRAGYQTIAWVNGGYDTCKKDLPTDNNIDIRYAGIGGLSEVLGWTEVQQDESREKLGGVGGVIKVFAIILLLDALLFGYENFVAFQKMNGSQ